MAHNKKCLHCNEPIPPKKRSDSEYCSEKCRKYASKKRKENGGKNRKANAGSLSGISDFQVAQPNEKNVVVKQTEKNISKPVEVPQPQKEIPLTFSMMPPLRGYVEDVAQVNLAKLPPPPEAPEPFNEERPMEIKKQFVSYAVNVPNPEYKRLFDAKQHQLKAIEAQKNLVAQHEKKLKDIRESSNVTALHYIVAGTGGGFIGNQSAEKNKVGGTLFGTLLAIAGMKIYQMATEENFQKQKVQAVKVQTENVRSAKAMLDEYNGAMKLLDEMLAKQSELLSQRKDRLENGEAVSKREQEIKEYEQRKNEAHLLSKKYGDEVAEYEKKYGSIHASTETSAEEIPPAQVNDEGVISSLGLNRVVGGALLLKGKWREFFGAPSRDFKLIIHGASFSGKSHLALQYGYYCAVHHGTVLYNTSEEGFSKTMDQKLEKLGAKVNGFDIGKFATAKELMEKIPRDKYNFIILDSVNDMNMTAEELQDLRKHYCCSAVIGICQNTKSGDIRGGYDLVHDADIKIRVENGIAYTDKNRFIDDRPELEIFKIGAVPPVTKISEVKKDEQKEISPTGGKIISLNEATQQKKIESPQQENNSDSNEKNNGDDWRNGNLDIDGLDHIL